MKEYPLGGHLETLSMDHCWIMTVKGQLFIGENTGRIEWRNLLGEMIVEGTTVGSDSKCWVDDY